MRKPCVYDHRHIWEERLLGTCPSGGTGVSDYCLLLQVLLPAASLLQLMDVRQNCCDFLQSQLHPTNCLGIRAFADVHTCTDLLQQANAYAGEARRPAFVSSGLMGLATRSVEDPLRF